MSSSATNEVTGGDQRILAIKGLRIEALNGNVIVDNVSRRSVSPP